jgi:hypothetical protein
MAHTSNPQARPATLFGNGNQRRDCLGSSRVNAESTAQSNQDQAWRGDPGGAAPPVLLSERENLGVLGRLLAG